MKAFQMNDQERKQVCAEESDEGENASLQRKIASKEKKRRIMCS